MNAISKTDLRQHRGFTLIELMVGMLISLIGTLAMLSAFALFEGQKRTTTAGNDAQENGSFVTYELERQIRSAGSGLIQGKNYQIPGCPIVAMTGGAAMLPKAAFPAPFSSFPGAMQAIPVLIQYNSGNASSATPLPDTIAIIGGNPSLRVFASAVQATTSSTSLVLNNGVGINPSDYFLGSPSGGNCVLGQLVKQTVTTPPTFSVLATSVPANGFVGAQYGFDMGPEPTVALYGVNTTVTPSTLDRYDVLAGTDAPIADGIIMVKALYGVDDGATTALPGSGTAGDDVIDEWVQPNGTTWGIAALMAGTPGAITSIAQIKAVRIAVVAQSNLAERKASTNANTPGYTGSGSLTLFPDLATTLQVKVTTSTNNRYKVYDVTIPVRNAFVTRFF